MGGYAYLDASAIVKLIVAEPETAHLEHDAVHRDGLFTSRLAVTEITRAAGRASHRRVLQLVDDVIASFVLVEVTPAVLDRAGRLDPVELRTPDAVHLATAASLDAPNLEFITYDARLARAAAAFGLRVTQPGV